MLDSLVCQLQAAKESLYHTWQHTEQLPPQQCQQFTQVSHAGQDIHQHLMLCKLRCKRLSSLEQLENITNDTPQVSSFCSSQAEGNSWEANLAVIAKSSLNLFSLNQTTCCDDKNTLKRVGSQSLTLQRPWGLLITVKKRVSEVFKEDVEAKLLQTSNVWNAFQTIDDWSSLASALALCLRKFGMVVEVLFLWPVQS